MAGFTKVGTYDGTSVISTTFNCSITNGNYAYIGSNAGLWILDITDKANPILLYQDTAIVDNCVGLAVSFDGNTIYAAGVGLSDKAVYVIDVTNKSAPAQIGEIDIADISATYNGFVGTNQTLLLSDANTLLVLIQDNAQASNVVQAIDITEPEAPVGLPNAIGNDFSAANVIVKAWAYFSDAYIVVLNSDTSVTTILQYAVNDPSNPVLSFTSVPIGGVEDVGGVFRENDYVCLIFKSSSWFLNTLRVGDLSQIIGELETDIMLDHPVYQISGSGENKGIIISVDIVGGGSTFAFDVSDPANPKQIQHDSQEGRSVFVAYPYFYTTDRTGSFFYSWLFSTESTPGWVYGDDNVIYKADI